MAEQQAIETRRRGSWKRRLAWAAGGFALVVLAAVATMDWWLPALGERFAGELSYARRTTEAGRTVSWRGVEWRGEGVTVRANEAEVSAPWRLVRRGKADAHVSGWSVEIAAARGDAPERDDSPAQGGWPELWQTLENIGAILEQRVGEVALTDGRVRVAGEEIAVPRFALRGGAAEGEATVRGQTVAFSFALPRGDFLLRHTESGAELAARLGGETIAGELAWIGNRATFAASGFAKNKTASATATTDGAGAGGEMGAWLPAEFAMEGRGWRVPAERLGAAAEYYDDLRGDFAVRGAGGKADVTVNAEAASRDGSLPPLRIALGGEASARRVRVERLEVESAAARARLGAPVEWSAEGGWNAPEAAEFTVSADLAALSARRVLGRLEGAARWRGGRAGWEARVTGGGWGEAREVEAVLKGESDLAATVIEAAEVTMAGKSRLSLSGRVAHADGGRLERGEIEGEVDGAALAPWLPEGLSVGKVELSAKAAGAVADLRGFAKARVERVAYGEWRADSVAFDGGWMPEDGWAGGVTVARGAARVEAEGMFKDGAARFVRLRWARGDGVELAGLGVGEAGPERVDILLTGGKDGRMERRLGVNWTRGGEASLVLDGWDTSWLDDWREGGAWPMVAVRSLAVTGREGEGGLIEGKGELDMAWRREGGPELWARFAGEADAGGLLVRKLAAGQGGETLASGSGRAPWRVRLGGAPELVAAEAGEWSLRLDSRPEATVWEALAKAAGVALERPALALALTGPATAPSGRVEFAAGRIGLSGEGLPPGGLALTGLDVAAQVTRGEVRVERMVAGVDGQRIEAEGRLDLGGDGWAQIQRQPFVWIRDHAEARVRLPEAKVAALARYLPTLLAPQGVLEADLRLSPGAKLDGVVRLREASTRPIGSFGVLQEIEVELLLSDHELKIGKMRAVAGGQEVSISGGARRVPGRIPLLDLQVKAERFPLVRRPGLLLRGDLDLRVKTAPAADGSAGRTRVSGVVRLRDSLFLADIRPLIAAEGGSSAAVRSRPPYFSVEAEPLAEWELDLRVTGDRFLRMRTPVFEGTGSAGFELEGTLREPRATGEFRVDRGGILFPFATFAVQEGAVRLSKADPFTPVLDFRATGRRLGYDLRLELNGTANSPQLQFYSSPPLEAETIVLMVTAGVAPSEREGTASTSQRLVAVGAYVGRDLLRTLGVGSADEERLTLSTGEKVSRQGRETYGFDFKLTERWSLTGEYDEFDAYNMGLKRRLRQAEPKPEETKKEAGDAR